MENVINTVVSSAPQQHTGPFRFELLGSLVDTKVGLALVTAVSVLLISVACEPPFLLYTSEDPLEEKKLSCLRVSVISVFAGLMVLAFPVIAIRVLYRDGVAAVSTAK
jgi:hypothetical protein